jgi:hypothetical protein
MTFVKKLQVVHIGLELHQRGGAPRLDYVKFYDTDCTTPIQVRNLLIKQCREEYKGGGERLDDLVTKFPFRDLVGFYYAEGGMDFVFPAGHPVFKLIASGKYNKKDIAEKLLDLHDYYYDLHQENRRKLAA